ncbi:hypothetical protein HDF26_002472 [Pedobacter cryoconitis]|nr:hypothetical protein [Pedobacter cryoconitis]
MEKEKVHSFTEKTLQEDQLKEIGESLWVAIRMMEERICY